MSWIEAALDSQGKAIGMRWLAFSRFKIPLRLDSSGFRRAWVVVEFSPPLSLTNRQDLITFHADLDWTPLFALEVHHFRWFARSGPKSSPTDQWALQHTNPFIITTRMDWQKEITAAMSSLSSNNHCEFRDIIFSRHSPHFSVTMPLEAVSPSNPARSCLFDAVRGAAASSLTSLF